MKISYIRSFLCAAAIVMIFSSGAFALSLDEAKTQGLVGESPSGYLESVQGNPSGEASSLVQDINARRREKYREIAQKNGTSLSAVETLAGKKAIDETPSGQYVKLPTGSWVRK